MPNYDRTGPYGMGPRTGRGFGPCGFGMGWRRFGHGRGLGRYYDWNEPQSNEEKLKALENYRKVLGEELEDVKKEEEELKKE
ncbi:hypothetical protein A2W13_01005 [Candidatus Woesebacteria bacterium RBG_16_36_11]|uniref:Cytoplasmic protein n=1 Tax=Candidatus Woesebacteria bacterium RBG_16_36_11 TaxID=1802481 RepID=A0A1F7XBR7_9BACT|nr:MAG: hypothetical protein A2W13_01005 [Candidatus Woesebacteria bacterium RBG_16_36_11]